MISHGVEISIPGGVGEKVPGSICRTSFFLFSFSFFFLYHVFVVKVQELRSAPSIFLSLKILTAFGYHKPQGLVFISSRYIYFGFSLGLHFQVKYIFHLC